MAKPKHCQVCGRETKHKSKTGRCLNCSINKNRAVVRQLRAKKGKHYKFWQQKIKEAVLNLPL